jgi:hypothetical protein
MTKTFAMAVSLALIVTLAVSPVWAVGDKVRSDNAAGPAGTTGGGEAEPNRGNTIGPNDQSLGVLTDAEIEDITYIREEEKLARDVYITLYEYYVVEDPIFAQIFGNISESEQRHMDSVKGLIDKYGLEDPVTNDSVGSFSNPIFVELFEKLVDLETVNKCGALRVGIFIEETDIADIEESLDHVTASDVSRVFNNLLNGSYNHWNAFDSRYETNNCE